MRRLSIYLALVLVCGASRAEQLTIGQCRETALQYNKSLKQASLGTVAATYDMRAAKALFLPDFSVKAFGMYDTATGGLSYDLSELRGSLAPLVTEGVQQGVLSLQQAQWLAAKAANIPGSIGMDYSMDWIYGGAVMLKQPLYMGGKIRAANRMTAIARNLSQESQRMTEAEVIQKTDEAYAKVVNAKELEQVARKYKELLVELDSNVCSAIRHGMGMENDRLRVQVRLNEVELQLRKAQNGIRLAKMNLCHMLGRPLDDEVDVMLEYPYVEEAVQVSDVSSRPEYAMLEGKARLAEQQVKMARSEMLPQLALLAKYGYTHGIEVGGNPLFDEWSFAGGLTLSVPLYHFGERANKVKSARIKLEQAQIEREEKVELMRLELAQAANTLDESKMEVELGEMSVKQAEESMRLSGKNYRSGLATLSDYLESQVQWQKAYESCVNSHFRLYLSSVDYLRCSGLLVP